jgi:hypothetical protein
MESSFCGSARMAFVRLDLLLLASLLIMSSAGAAGLSEAQLTRIIKEVKLLPVQTAPRAAALNDSVNNGTAVRTGAESRAELTFKDLTITRLGADTIFSFNEGTRNLDLGGGAILVHVPKDAGGAKITTAAITAGITGTTVLLEVHRNNYSKAAVLEGIMHVALPNDPSEAIDLHPGQMVVVPPNAKRMPKAITVNLKLLVESSPLITEFSPLPSAPLIAEEIARQQAEGAPAQSEEEPPIDVLDQRFNVTSGTSGGGAVSKFGPINTITTPNPYVITSGTNIRTDPKITTNGKTDLGKIYRGPPTDGSASSYFFGSTTTADQDFDSIGETPSTSQVAGFKFSSLQLAGNPTVSLGNGGPSALALISVGNITTSGAGLTLTFSNLNFVAIATQAGSIDLGANIAFSSMPELFLYARGAGSNLTVASPMANMERVTLDSEGNVQINANEDVQALRSFSNNFLAGSGNLTVHAGVSLNSINALNFAMARWVFDPATQPEVNLTGDVVNIDNSGGFDAFKNAGIVGITGNTQINFTAAETVTFSNLTATLTAGSGGLQASSTAFVHPGDALDILSGGSVVAKSIIGGDIVQSSAGDITMGTDLSSRIVNAFGNVTVGGNLTSSQLVQAGGNVSAGSGTLTALDVEAGGDVDAAHVSVLTLNGNVTTSSTTLSAGAGGITPYLLSSSNQHTFTVATVESNTAATGIDFSGNNFSVAASSGASLTLNTQLQVFSAATGINNANFNGKDGPNPGDIPGDGGSLTVLDQQGITMNSNTISATTGIISANAGQPPAGAGGNVNFTTNGPLQITTNSVIKVSSSDPAGTVNRRSSVSGGNITLQSDVATGVAIQVDSSSQLLALLDAAAPGPGGKIVLRASGPTSSIQAGGTMRADGGTGGTSGTIDIRHSGDSGSISVNSANLRSDIIKVATLGASGNLTIGTGNTITANTLLKLYADGSNGTLNFIGNVTLTSQSTILAANTINISNGITVTITSPVPAQVFADNRNYQGPGGTGGAGTGMFGGTGAPTALTTAGFGARPPLGSVGGP